MSVGDGAAPEGPRPELSWGAPTSAAAARPSPTNVPGSRSTFLNGTVQGRGPRRRFQAGAATAIITAAANTKATKLAIDWPSR